MTTQAGLSGPIAGNRITIYRDGGGQWSALYLDGKLITRGDHDNVMEKLIELTGVNWVQDSAFLMPDGRNVCMTTEEVEQRIAERALDLNRAREYELQAVSLREKAAGLRQGWRA